MNINLSVEDLELLREAITLACGAALDGFDIPLSERLKKLAKTINTRTQP